MLHYVTQARFFHRHVYSDVKKSIVYKSAYGMQLSGYLSTRNIHQQAGVIPLVYMNQDNQYLPQQPSLTDIDVSQIRASRSLPVRSSSEPGISLDNPLIWIDLKLPVYMSIYTPFSK